MLPLSVALLVALFVLPLVILATAATVVASQAVISGAFSLTRQAIRLGLCPRMRVVRTSASQPGEVYLPVINALLLGTTVALVLGFGASERLASAYGLAVSGTMVITTLLAFAVARERARWSVPRTVLVIGPFLLVDALFLVANSSKLLDGGWLPVLMAGVAFTVMLTWHWGRQILAAHDVDGDVDLAAWVVALRTKPPVRVGGTAVFLSRHASTVPPVLLEHLWHNQVLHHQVVLLTVITEKRPRVPLSDRYQLEKLGFGVFRFDLRCGFMETPDVPAAMNAGESYGLETDAARTTYYLGRRTVTIAAAASTPARWRKLLFSFLYRNASTATGYLRIPPDQVVEVGTQVEV